MLYKHWKKIAIALTGFFWASCDETASGPVTVNPDTPSNTISENTEGGSSSSKANNAASSETAKSAASSAEEASITSNAEEAGKSSSSKAKSAASSAEEASEESGAEASNAQDTPNPGTDTTSTTKSSSSVKKPRSSSSHLDEPVDLYGCPSDICGPFIADTASISDTVSIIAAKYGVIRPKSSSSFSQIAAKYGVILPESSSSFSQIVAKYGVPNKPTCEPSMSEDGTISYKCSDGVTCVEKTTTEMQAPACNGNVCPKYGVVKISKKTYTCDNGQTYNEAEFQMLYDMPIIETIEVKPVVDSVQMPIALYGPPCVFNNTCGDEDK
jgi:hypothetical protein